MARALETSRPRFNRVLGISRRRSIERPSAHVGERASDREDSAGCTEAEPVVRVEEEVRRLARARNSESVSRHPNLPFCRSTGAPSPVNRLPHPIDQGFCSAR